MTKLGVLASGRGSNFHALIEAQKRGNFSAAFTVLISDQANAGALSVARENGIRAIAISPKDFPSREAHEGAVVKELENSGVELVCLAGYMRIVSAPLINRFRNKILNIHPALLPAFPGLHGQKQALLHGAKVSGATVHFVDEGCDTGPIILQAAVPVEENDTEESLSARILREEHRIYPQAVHLYCEGRLKIEGRRVHILPPGQKKEESI